MVREEKTMTKERHEAGTNPAKAGHVRKGKKMMSMADVEMPLTNEEVDTLVIELAKMHGLIR